MMEYIECPNDPILQEDLMYIAENCKELNSIHNSAVFVTGATGLIGTQLVRAIACYNRVKNANITILALIRDNKKALSIYGDMLKRDDIKLVVGDATEDLNSLIPDNQEIDYIIHAASITRSKTMITKPVETISTALYGTNNVLKLAMKKKSKSVVYISSMEMYGTYTEPRFVDEKDIGYLDPLAVRSNYPESKRMCENMCIAYLTEYNVPVKIIRLSQTFGAGILPDENRIFAQIAKSIINCDNIILHTKGLSCVNFCYTRDAVCAIFTVMLKGNNGEAYNVVNEESHMTIAEMCEMLCNKLTSGKSKVVFEISENNSYGYAAENKMKLRSEKLKKLGWLPTVNLENAYMRMIRSMLIAGNIK